MFKPTIIVRCAYDANKSFKLLHQKQTKPFIIFRYYAEASDELAVAISSTLHQWQHCLIHEYIVEAVVSWLQCCVKLAGYGFELPTSPIVTYMN